MDNKRVLVTDLDFDQIKSNLKNFLKGQDQFSDYDFEGSGMSVMLDVLAYNTHYNAMYANLAMNEAFLDSASKRSNVVSHAKSLGYVPTSCKSAIAVINLTVINPVGANGETPRSITLPELSQFLTSIDGITYSFYNRSAITVTPNAAGEFIFENVQIYEGTPLRHTFQVIEGKRYIIPNSGCDLSTMTVRVQDTSSTAGYAFYSRGDDYSTIKGTDNVYFVSEVENELYEIYFGDGRIGRQLSSGNIITVDYMVCNKDAPNNAKSFTFNGSVSNGTPVVATVSAAQGGSDIESIDSIKLHAPKNYSAQNRAVTSEDYKVILPQIYPNIESVSVWGGEENDPPRYGKVFISIKPKSGETLTTSTKEIIKKSILRSKNIVSITPEIVDPDYLYVSIAASVFYNPLQTEKNPDTLRTLVLNTITNYDGTDLRRFGGVFRFSKLSRLIDTTDTSFTSTIMNIRISKIFYPSINQQKKYTITMNNPIYNEGVPEEAVKSSAFRIADYDGNVYIDDDGLGNLRLFYYTGTSTKVFLNKNVGTVNYGTGTITINDFIVESAPNNAITLYCVPDSHDVVSVRNQIVAINHENTKLEVVVDTVASGQFTGGTNYNFRSSHEYGV
jgi:hypothetical protein